jgi:hypothetical protein
MTTRATAAAAHEILRVVPPGGEAYAYRLPVPCGWAYGGSVGRALELDTIPRPLGTFVSPDRSVSMVVAMTPLPIEVRLEEWVGAELGHAGWHAEEMSWHRIAGAPKLAIAARKQGQLRAIAAMADGGRLYAVYVQGPSGRAAEIAERLWGSAMAFDPYRRTGIGRLEARQRVTVGAHRFEAPISWTAAAPEIDALASRTRLVLRHPTGIERGRVSVRIDHQSSTSTPIEQRRAATLAALTRRGLVLARKVEVPKPAWHGLPRDWEVVGISARNRGGAVVDLWIAHGNSGEQCAEVLAVGTRDTPRSWMRTARALELACMTIEAATQRGGGGAR